MYIHIIVKHVHTAQCIWLYLKAEDLYEILSTIYF